MNFKNFCSLVSSGTWHYSMLQISIEKQNSAATYYAKTTQIDSASCFLLHDNSRSIAWRGNGQGW